MARLLDPGWGRCGLVPVAVALLTIACRERPAPATAPVPPPEVHAAVPNRWPVDVEVLTTSAGTRRGLEGIEVRFLPGDVMERHLASQGATSTRLAELRQEGARLSAELARRRTENDAANQAYMVGAADYLRERAALNLRQGQSAAQGDAARRTAAARRRAIRSQASDAARRALAAEQRTEEIALEVGRLRAGLLEALPPPVASGRSGPAGEVAVSVPPGRYAVLAVAPTIGRAPPWTWLAWLELDGTAGAHLVLDDAARDRGIEPSAPEGGTAP